MKDETKEINLNEMLFNRDERLLNYIYNLKKENHELKIYICNYRDRLENMLENGSKTYIRENVKNIIRYMDNYVKDIFKGNEL